jgi:hypothetical protein
MNTRLGTNTALLFACCFYAVSALAADTITGKVRNQTTRTVAAGDEVVLLRLGVGMEEEARTRTDAQGAFAFPATSDARHIVRVLHQGVNYDQVATSSPLEVLVFDAVTKIPGLSGNMGIVRVETEGEMLKVTEMYSIKNASAPPVTQRGPRNFVASLAPDATLDSFMVKSQGAVWVKVTPTANAERGSLYSVDFPLRPGDTLFKFTYRLPYQGRSTLRIRLAYPIRNIAVLHPPSMSFKPASQGSFTSPGLVQGLRLEQAVAQPVVRELPAFEISGAGAAPQTSAEAKPVLPPTPSLAPVPVGASASQAGISSPPAPSAWTTNAGWLVGLGIGALLTALIFGLLHQRRNAAKAHSATLRRGVSVVEVLKEELFQLETEKLKGSLSAEQYDANKEALKVSIQRALAKGKRGGHCAT